MPRTPVRLLLRQPLAATQQWWSRTRARFHRADGARAGASRAAYGWLAAALLLLGAGALAAWAEAAGWPFLRQPLQRALSNAAAVPVSLGGPQDHFRLSLFGQPALSVAAMTVDAAPGPPAPHLLSGRGLQLQWRWRDVWHWWRQAEPLRLVALTADSLDLQLLRDKAGRATWQLGAANAESRGPQDPALFEGLPRVERLIVRAGQIVLDDQRLDTRLRVALRGEEGSAARDGVNQGVDQGAVPRSPAGWRADIEGRWQALPLQLQVNTGGLLPLIGPAEDADMALRVQGRVGAARVAFNGQANAMVGARRLAGDLIFSGPSLDRVGEPLRLTLPTTAPFELRGRLVHDGGVWGLQASTVSIGRSRLGGDFTYDTRPATPLLSGRLNGSRLLLADLGPSVGAGAGAVVATGRVLPSRTFDLPSLQRMDADLAVDLRELDFGTDGLAPLRDLTARLRLQDGKLALDGLQAVVAGGRVAGSSSYDGRTAPARWTARLQFKAVDLAGWVRATGTDRAPSAGPPTASKALRQQRQQVRRAAEQAAPAASAPPVRNYITGALDAGLDVRGQGRSVADILSTLDGRLDLSLSEGTLSHLATEVLGLDLAQALGVLLRGDRPLALRCAKLQATARAGIVTTDRGVIDNQDSTILLAGQVNLKDETLALVAKARPKDVSPLSLRVPITVRGTLARPEVGVEQGPLLGKLGAAVLAGAALGPLAALLPLVDVGNKVDGDACAAPAAPAPPPAVASAPAGTKR